MRFFRNHFIARLFLTTFVCVHLPLIFAVIHGAVQARAVDYAALGGLTLATVAGTAVAILLLHRELRPVVAVAHALEAFAERREHLPIAHQSADEVGRLADAARWSIGKVDSLLADVERQASTDALTGLANRRAFLAAVAAEKPAVLAILDIDRFKSINDTFGHETGDRVLRDVAGTLRNSLRSADLVARWGGEEFVVLLRRSCAAEAIEAMNRARKAVEAKPILEGHAVTFSAGVVQMSGDFDRDLALADRTLYDAKEAGRNRVVFAAATRGPAETPGLAPSAADLACMRTRSIKQNA